MRGISDYFGQVPDSYGRKSPGTRDNTFACMISPNGIISVNSAYSYSYG